MIRVWTKAMKEPINEKCKHENKTAKKDTASYFAASVFHNSKQMA